MEYTKQRTDTYPYIRYLLVAQISKVFHLLGTVSLSNVCMWRTMSQYLERQLCLWNVLPASRSPSPTFSISGAHPLDTEYIKIIKQYFKGSLTRDFRSQFYFMNQCPPGPQVFPWGRFEFFRKFAEIFAN